MELHALLTTFGLVFLLELPDKTAYTVLVLSTRNRGLPVLFGAWAAFAVQALVAVLVGRLFANLAPAYLRWGTALLFAAFGLLLLLGKDEAPAEGLPPAETRRIFVTSFALVFLAELGDATQLATAALAAGSRARWSVFLGAVLALWAVAAIAVALGRRLGHGLPTKALRRVAGAIFLALAAYVALRTS